MQYYPAIDRFLVVGNYASGGGFAYLFDNNGNLVAQNTSLPAIPREAQPAERAFAGGVKVVYPRSPNGAFVLWVTSSSIALDQTITDSYNWSYIGTDGIFLNDTQAYFVSGSTGGLVEKTFAISGVTPPTSTPTRTPTLLPGGATTICRWKDCKAGAYTLTYDDGIWNSLVQFEALHQKYGLVGTMGLVSQWINDQSNPDGGSIAPWAQYKAMADRGYLDIASHTHTHPHLAGLTPAQMDAEFATAISQIQANTGYTPQALIYPYYEFNDTVKTEAAKYHIAAREAGDNSGNAPDTTNYYALYSNSVYADTAVSEMNGWVDTVISTGNWMIVTAHGMSDYDPTTWEASPKSKFDSAYAYLSSKLNVVWNGTFVNVAKYLRERQSATVSVVSSSAGQIVISLTDTLDNGVYNYPLTLKTQVPASWSAATVLQGTTSVIVVPVVEGGNQYIYYGALPDGGQITITAGNIVTSTPTSTPTPTRTPTGIPPTTPVSGVIAQDGFENAGWNGGTGWNAAWTHSGDSAITTAGTAHSGSYHLRLRRATGLASRSLNLAGASNVRLQFWWKANSFESGENAQVIVNDGSNHVVLQVNDGQDDNAYHFADIDLSGFSMTGNFVVKFDANMNATNDYFYVDDLKIVAGGVSPSATPIAGTLLSRNRPASASSIEGTGFEAGKAFDGGASTRWASQEGVDPQWIYVDLGATATITRVSLNWEDAYGKVYQLQVSNDAVNWTTIYAENNGDGGSDDLTGLSASGRYVRLYATQRGTEWGYSLWEFEVYGILN